MKTTFLPPQARNLAQTNGFWYILLWTIFDAQRYTHTDRETPSSSRPRLHAGNSHPVCGLRPPTPIKRLFIVKSIYFKNIGPSDPRRGAHTATSLALIQWFLLWGASETIYLKNHLSSTVIISTWKLFLLTFEFKNVKNERELNDFLKFHLLQIFYCNYLFLFLSINQINIYELISVCS